MSGDEKTLAEEIAEVLSKKLQADGRGQAACCGGLSSEETEMVKEWTKKGGFTDSEFESLKDFLGMVNKGKKWIAIIFGALLLMAAKDIWSFLKTAGKAIASYMANGGG